jgi:hypothetical protein
MCWGCSIKKSIKANVVARKCEMCNCSVSKNSKSGLCKQCVSRKRMGKFISVDMDVIKKQIEQYGVVETSRMNGVSHTTVRRWLKMV